MAPSPPYSWQIVSECLDHVLDLAEAERAGWLETLSLTQPELAAEVSQLLSQNRHAGYSEFLESPLLHPKPTLADAALVGRRVGPYLIERQIGHGGMGSVWLARRTDERFDAVVAIKFLHASWLGFQGEQRFRSEGQLLGRLQHPNIARLIDAGVLESTHPYLVIEYVDGESIDAYCDRERLGLEARLKVFLDVLAAVSHAHAHLVVHRDLKPRNVLVTRSGIVKLLDFGVAKLMDSAVGAAEATNSTATALTPQFAAPEQFLGQAATIATDVYSLGLTLYLLLTGRLPFGTQSTSGSEHARASLTEEVPRVSTVAGIRSIPARSLEGDIDNIAAKATRKSAEERYPSVDAFADDLRRFLQHEPVKARADTTAYRMSKFVRRHRGGVATGVLTALALCVATAMTFLQKVEAERQKSAAEFEARRAESANDFLNLLLLSDVGGQAASTRIDGGAHMLELQYRDDPAFAGRMLVQLSTQYRGRTLTNKALELDRKAYVLGKGAGDSELMTLAQCAAVYAAASAGRAEDAAPRLTEAKQLLAEVHSPSVSLRTDCARAEAMLDVQLGRFVQAERTLTDARKLLEQSGQAYRATYTSVLNDLGGVYNETGRPADALSMARLIGAIHERYGRGGTTARIMALQNEAAVLLGMGEALEAARVSAEVRRRRAAIQGDSSEPLSMSVNYAEMLARLGRMDEAAELARAAHDRAAAAGNALWQVSALRTLGNVYLEAGDFSSTESTIADIVAAISHSAITEPHFLMLPNRLRAELEIRQGNADAALREIQGLLSAASATKKTVEYRTYLTLAAEASLILGRPADAERYARAALPIAESASRASTTSGDVGEILLLNAKADIAQNHSAVAKPLLQRAVQCLTNGFGADHRLTREAKTLAASI